MNCSQDNFIDQVRLEQTKKQKQLQNKAKMEQIKRKDALEARFNGIEEILKNARENNPNKLQRSNSITTIHAPEYESYRHRTLKVDQELKHFNTRDKAFLEAKV